MPAVMHHIGQGYFSYGTALGLGGALPTTAHCAPLQQPQCAAAAPATPGQPQCGQAPVAATAAPLQQGCGIAPTPCLEGQGPLASAAALADLGMRLKAAGDWRGAGERYYEALRHDPTLYAAQYNLGALFLAAGDLQRALEHTERAYTAEPRSADAMHNLGEIYRGQGNFHTAVQWYRAALRVAPNCDTTHSNLSLSLVSLGLQIKPTDPKGAIKCYQEALVHCPTSASAYYNLGVSYAELRKTGKALVNYSLAVHFNPRCAEAYNNMGVIYKEQENLEKSLKCYHAALQCNPRFAQTLNNLGVAYTTTGHLTEALEYLSRAVAVAPTYAEAYNNLGWLFWDHGDMAQALRMYERCIELSPSSKNPSQNRLLALNYLHDVSPERVFEAHKAWGERFSNELGLPFTEWHVTRNSRRKLRIGYISPDFFQHSVSFFAQALLEHRTQDMFDVILYSNTTREDDKTELFKTMVPEGCWRKIVGQTAHEVANMIREDRIDILVELAGHTANNRLDVIALKPAPVQITYIGYNNTTGLGAVDYRITDAVVDPLDTEQPFSEELIRLPGCFLCYTPPARYPDVDQLPALREGFITFGSFSCLAKIGQPCIALWARVLREVPGSRLLVKNKGFYSAEVQANFVSQMKSHGIPEHRLKLMSLAPTSFEHLRIYNEVDIALDTFPYSNTTTTCETLLMGVPAVCLAGNTHGSRVGVTLLTAVGLSDLIASSKDEYVHKAKGLASDLTMLANLRQSLRPMLFASTLCDGQGFVKDKYEPALRERWQAFCDGRPPSVQTFSGPAPPDPLAPGPFAPPLPLGAPVTGTAPAQAPVLAVAPQSPSPPPAAAVGAVPAGAGANALQMNGAAAVPLAQCAPQLQAPPAAIGGALTMPVANGAAAAMANGAGAAVIGNTAVRMEALQAQQQMLPPVAATAAVPEAVGGPITPPISRTSAVTPGASPWPTVPTVQMTTGCTSGYSNSGSHGFQGVPGRRRPRARAPRLRV